MDGQWKQINKIHMGKAACAVDLGDGSERGEYVNQDYILRVLGRPHRSISLMYCYYPLDEGWPARASVAFADKQVGFAWDYPYDDYFPYTGGLEGDTKGELFECMRDVRRHGQDVTLTLTIDPHVSDAQLARLGQDLSTFGRLFLRINHEATGDWFSFNKRCSYQEVADFFVRASRIIKENAPNVSTIICIEGVPTPKSNKIIKEEEFARTIPAADIWSVDKYMALHWGWPYDVAEPGGSTHKRDTVKFTFDLIEKSYECFKRLNGGQPKPMIMSELNSDGDVTGPYEQAEMVRDFYGFIKKKDARWFSGLTFYQFRDRGRLGLEIEDPNNPEVGMPQPVLDTYREIIHDPWFQPEMTAAEPAELPVTLRWGGAEDAEGLSLPLILKANPVFCELYFEDDSNLMLEINGIWFYKSPKAKVIDLMPAFFQSPLSKKKELTLKIFAPPASGENTRTEREDWTVNHYTTLHGLPRLRVRYDAVEK